ncbi:hypothetical protein [Stenotrophomonas sp. PD6]|uniref:hypothetical protein n=1 Tax=Stenotrophomonas sp. PD6 TaxID=3368612 RepID=UPI003BA04BA6
MQIEGARRDRLASLLTGEQILFVSIPADQSMGQAWYALAALASGRGVVFSGSSTEVGGWEECGTMNVEFLAPSPPLGEWAVQTELDGFVIQSVFVLVVDDAQWQIEAGLAIFAEDGRQLLFVAGDIPGAFSMMMPNGQGELRPQFPWQDYRRTVIDAT